MKAIQTHYVGPTNSRGARIIADDGDGNRVTVSYSSALSSEDAHRKAAVALCDKVGWSGAETLVSGSTKRGYAFVFTGSPLPQHVPTCEVGGCLSPGKDQVCESCLKYHHHGGIHLCGGPNMPQYVCDWHAKEDIRQWKRKREKAS